MYTIIAAIATALAMIVVTNFLSKHIPVRLWGATILCSIAFIYVGFSLKGNPAAIAGMEILVALAFSSMALVGFTVNTQLLGVGIILHGVWDVMHHGSWLLKTDVPEYWPMYCMIVDVIYGVYFLLVSKKLDMSA